MTFNDLDAGQHFSKISAIDSELRSARIMALTKCNVAIMLQGQFLNLLEKELQIALQLMHGLTSMVRASTIPIMDLNTLAANNRVQADLLRVVKTEVDDDGSAVISRTPVCLTILRVRGSLFVKNSVFIINDLGSLRRWFKRFGMINYLKGYEVYH